MSNRSLAELLRALAVERARVIVAGGLARALHGQGGDAEDRVLWYDVADAAAVYRALERLGAPLEGVAPEDLEQVEYAYRWGDGADEVRLVGGVDGATFTDAWNDRTRSRYGDIPVDVLGRATLAALDAAARPSTP